VARSPSSKRAIPVDPTADHAHSPLVQARLADSGEALFVEELTVEELYDGWRIDRFLTASIPRTSRTQIQQYLKHNIELVPPRRVKASIPVRTGDIIRIVRRELIRPGLPSPDEMVILEEQEDTVVISKPPGILVHRNSREVSHTVDAFLAQHFRDRPHVEAVHRLDRETSGCMLAAFGKPAVSHWRVAFQQRDVEKVYLAIVHDPEGRWPLGHEWLIDIPLGFDPNSELSLRMGRGTLSARTNVIVRQRDGHYALVELHPTEGRQHQLRAHLSLSGTPIVGDKLYAAGDEYFMRWSDDPVRTQEMEPLESPYHCLHAWQLKLTMNGERRRFIAPLPPHFFQVMPSLSLPW